MRGDEVAQLQHRLLFKSDALLLGRVTYQGFAKAWPDMTDDDGFAERMNSLPKFVVSNTLKETEWNASLIQEDAKEDVVGQVKKLKQEDGQNLLIYGSATLVQTLMQADLIDEFRLMIYPLSLGKGKRLFAEGSEARLKLVDTQMTHKGVAILSYELDKSR